MLFSEFRRWVSFRRLRGSLHMGFRIEQSSALLATLYHNAHVPEGKQKKVTHFMPHMEQGPETLEEAMETWR